MSAFTLRAKGRRWWGGEASMEGIGTMDIFYGCHQANSGSIKPTFIPHGYLCMCPTDLSL